MSSEGPVSVQGMQEVKGAGWVYRRTASGIVVHREGQALTAAASLVLAEDELFGFVALTDYAGLLLMPDKVADVAQGHCPVIFAKLGLTTPVFQTFGVPPHEKEIVHLPGHVKLRVVQVEWTYEPGGARSALVLCE